MTAACRACALVDLRACSSLRVHSALQSIAAHAQGRYDAAPDTARLLPALQSALLDPPDLFIVAGDDQTFSWAAQHLVACGEGGPAVAFVGAPHGVVRRLCALPNQGVQQQLAQLDALIKAENPTLNCIYVPVLRLSDSIESNVKYGFFCSFGSSTRALEWAHKLPYFAQKIGDFSFNLAMLIKDKARATGAYIQVFLGDEGRPVGELKGAWVGVGDGRSGVRVGLGSVSSAFSGFLLGISPWVREQIPLWGLEQRVRVELEGEHVMYGWGGGLCFGEGPRMLEISRGDSLNIIKI